MSANSEDCACCRAVVLRPGQKAESGDDRDSAVVAAFLAGVMSREQNVTMDDALCADHAVMAKGALRFLLEQMRKR